MTTINETMESGRGTTTSINDMKMNEIFGSEKKVELIEEEKEESFSIVDEDKDE